MSFDSTPSVFGRERRERGCSDPTRLDSVRWRLVRVKTHRRKTTSMARLPQRARIKTGLRPLRSEKAPQNPVVNDDRIPISKLNRRALTSFPKKEDQGRVRFSSFPESARGRKAYELCDLGLDGARLVALFRPFAVRDRGGGRDGALSRRWRRRRRRRWSGGGSRLPGPVERPCLPAGVRPAGSEFDHRRRDGDAGLVDGQGAADQLGVDLEFRRDRHAHRQRDHERSGLRGSMTRAHSQLVLREEEERRGEG